MRSYLQKVLFILLGFALLATAVVVTFYDQLPQSVRPSFRNMTTGSKQRSADESETPDLLKSLTDDSTLLDAEYNFKSVPQTDTLEAPDFASELDTATQQ